MVILHYANRYNKVSLLNVVNNNDKRKLPINKYSEVTNTLINNLTYINKYINSTLIIKENRLKLSILGGRYNKTARYKNDKKTKRSELASFSHALKHVHRYEDQVHSTIENSTFRLNKESGVISQIIPIIRNHPYTYNYYLNKMKVSIPDISFFINNNNLLSTNNLNSKTSDISNNSYGISTNNINLNSIANSSEEDGAGASIMYSAGSSIYYAAFKKITFQANIITFDINSNSFKYETPTAVENTTNKTISSIHFNLENSEILNDNYIKAYNSSYFCSSREVLSGLNSSNNNLVQNFPTPAIPSYLPDYFNKHLSNAAVAKVGYNHISSFKNNYSVYYPAIFIPLSISLVENITIGNIHISLGFLTKKLQKKISNNFDAILNKLYQDIEIGSKEEMSNEKFTIFTDATKDKFTLLERNVWKNPLKESDRNRILTIISNTKRDYNSKTYERRKELSHLSKTENLSNSFIASSLTNSTSSSINNDKLVKEQNEHLMAIQNIITQYEIDKDNISIYINDVESQESLNLFTLRIIKPFNAELMKLNENTSHVNINDAPSLITELKNIIDDIIHKSTGRSKIIRDEEEIVNKLTEERNIKKISDKAIKKWKKQIKKFDNPYVDTEEHLDAKIQLIQSDFNDTSESVSQKDYNGYIGDTLKQEVKKLQSLLEIKATNARTRIREGNKVSAEGAIDSHIVKIKNLTLEHSEESLINEAGVYNDHETSQKLTTAAGSLDKLIDDEVIDLQLLIEWNGSSRDILSMINTKLQIAETILSSEEDQLNDIHSTHSFINWIEGEITYIVKKTLPISKDISVDALRIIDSRVNNLRKGYKKLYKEKSEQFIKESDNTKETAIAYLNKKEEELKIQQDIQKNKENIETHQTVIEIGSAKNPAAKKPATKIDVIRAEIWQVKAELAARISDDEKVAKFKLPSKLINIFERW